MGGHRGGGAAATGWRALAEPQWLPVVAVLLSGILLHSMNVLLLATVLPGIVEEVGGADRLSWPTTAYLASSIIAAACTAVLIVRIGPKRTFMAGALVFSVAALGCALAPSMDIFIGARFLQGFGGGLLGATAYVLVRSTFPQSVWPRVFALMAGVWSVSVLVGPLVGGVFASLGDWRGAFLAVAVAACLIAIAADAALPAVKAANRGQGSRPPFLRIGLVTLAIAIVSAAAIAETTLAKAGLVAAAFLGLALMLRLDRRAANPLLPSDAFSLGSATGVGLWVAFLICAAFTPLQLFAPMFLQLLHGFDPLSAGYIAAGSSMAWTVAALIVAGLEGPWPNRMIIIGPLVMAAGLGAVATTLPSGPIFALIASICAVGAGIGSSWAFIAQCVMRNARAGEEDIAAAAVATVQQAGLAFGAAIAGLIANAAGFGGADWRAGAASAAFWAPASFIVVAAAAALMGCLLQRLAKPVSAIRAQST
jgi:MFS family permease